MPAAPRPSSSSSQKDPSPNELTQPSDPTTRSTGRETSASRQSSRGTSSRTSRGKRNDDGGDPARESAAKKSTDDQPYEVHLVPRSGQTAVTSTQGATTQGATTQGATTQGAPTQGSAQTLRLPKVPRNLPLHKRPAEALRLAHEAFTQTGYWIVFYRAILGPEGIVRKLFPEEGEFEYFASTREFEECHKMLTALRSSDTEKAETVEPQKMLTIRLPVSLYDALAEEAERARVSVNKLGISKLLLPVNPDFIPIERGMVRGRKPKR